MKVYDRDPQGNDSSKKDIIKIKSNNEVNIFDEQTHGVESQMIENSSIRDGDPRPQNAHVSVKESIINIEMKPMKDQLKQGTKAKGESLNQLVNQRKTAVSQGRKQQVKDKIEVNHI